MVDQITPEQFNVGAPVDPAMSAQDMAQVQTPNIQQMSNQARTSGDVRHLQGDLLQKQAGLDRQIGAQQLTMDQQKATDDTRIAQMQTAGMDQANQAYEDKIKQFPFPEFHPTQDNISSLATLFSLVGVIGMSMGGQGQMSATNALNSMGGMMKGWQQGRADLFKNEKENFDKEMVRVKALHDEAEKDMRKAVEMMPYKKEEAAALARQAVARLGGQIGKQILERQGIVAASQYLQGIGKDIQHTEDMQAKLAATMALKEQTLAMKEQAQTSARLDKPGGAQAVDVKQVIGKDIGAPAAQQVMGAVNYIHTLREMRSDMNNHPELAGVRMRVMAAINQYLPETGDPELALQKAIENKDKNLKGLSDQAILTQKTALDGAFQGIRAKYPGSRPPLQEFQALQRVLTPGGMSSDAFVQVINREANSAIRGLRGEVTPQDFDKIYRHYEGQGISEIANQAIGKSRNAPPEAVSQLKASPTAQNKIYFDEIFGDGAANRELGAQ